MSILGKEACRTGGPGGTMGRRVFHEDTFPVNDKHETDGSEGRSASYHHIKRRNM